MITKTRFNRSGGGRRGGFTLMEMMVVITIMAALVALSASAVIKFMGVQQTTNTQSTLDRVQSQLARAWSKVKDDAYYKSAMTEPPYVPGTYPPVLDLTAPTVGDWIKNKLTTGTADPNFKERTKVIYTKLRLRQAFPMSFKEALSPGPLPPLPAYVTYLNSHGIFAKPALQLSPIGPQESSVCLLMALQRGVSGAGIDPSELTAGGAAGTDNNGFPYLTDAWGRPIFFTRVPAGNLYLNPNTLGVLNTYNLPLSPTLTYALGLPPLANCYSLSGNNDPGDPQGTLVSAAWRKAYGLQFFGVTSEVVPWPTAPNTSFRLAPMVASGGPSDWTKPLQILPFDPITFSAVPGGNALFSTPK